jgi:hypothetical protein
MWGYDPLVDPRRIPWHEQKILDAGRIKDNLLKLKE